MPVAVQNVRMLSELCKLHSKHLKMPLHRKGGGIKVLSSKGDFSLTELNAAHTKYQWMLFISLLHK